MAEHTHPDPGRLHFACPACYAAALDDRRQTEIAEAARFTCHVVIKVYGQRHGVPVVLGWPAAWPPREVVEFYLAPDPWPEVRDAVTKFVAGKYPDGVDDALGNLMYIDLRKGAPVPVQRIDPMEGQPTLFG